MIRALVTALLAGFIVSGCAVGFGILTVYTAAKTAAKGGPVDMAWIAGAAAECRSSCDLTSVAEWTASQEGQRQQLACACKHYSIGGKAK